MTHAFPESISLSIGSSFTGIYLCISSLMITPFFSKLYLHYHNSRATVLSVSVFAGLIFTV